MASKTDKKRSQFFRVAVEGATTDGRVIERQQIVEMAETYDPEVYGARIWVEHYRSALPDSPFRAYGDACQIATAMSAVDKGRPVSVGALLGSSMQAARCRSARGHCICTSPVNTWPITAPSNTV
ncbi:GPO family capsid scaffolding protein [Stenotrophomonas rhizophila]|uniref:GPO family capsid scaffolding protein n=1 Tax=Stenotrophomonas rhizophila TaxID=216778 RepID=UPI00081CE9C8|nr:phage capsid scaffolding protein [Stenotrophomonas rhizophila]